MQFFICLVSVELLLWLAAFLDYSLSSQKSRKMQSLFQKNLSIYLSTLCPKVTLWWKVIEKEFNTAGNTCIINVSKRSCYLMTLQGLLQPFCSVYLKMHMQNCKIFWLKFPLQILFVYIRSPTIKTMIPGGTLRLWCIHISQLIAHVAWIDVLLTLQLCNSKYITNIPASRHITVGS